MKYAFVKDKLSPDDWVILKEPIQRKHSTHTQISGVCISRRYYCGGNRHPYPFSATDIYWDIYEYNDLEKLIQQHIIDLI